MIEHSKEVYEEFRKSNPDLHLSDEEIALIINTRELSNDDYKAVLLYIKEIVNEKDQQKR